MGSSGNAIDLHIHSTSSDGTLSPQEIVATALALGLRAIAITDHDTLQGAKQALRMDLPPCLGYVPGVEISADIPEPFPTSGTLHILGYYVDVEARELNRTLKTLQDARARRNPRILERLHAMGVSLSWLL